MTVIYERETERSIDEIAPRLEEAAARHKFGVLGEIDLKAKMNGKGVDFEPQCRVYEVCNPHKAKEALETDLAMAGVLPCRIAAYEKGGKVTVSTVLPTKILNIFDSPGLAPMAEEVEKTIIAMIDEIVSP